MKGNPQHLLVHRIEDSHWVANRRHEQQDPQNGNIGATRKRNKFSDTNTSLLRNPEICSVTAFDDQTTFLLRK